MGGVAGAAERDLDVACLVKDSTGKVLDADRAASSLSTLGQQLTASSAVFQYDVLVQYGGTARMELTDLRSGDRALANLGNFERHEEVSLSLTADEAPEDTLRLECVRRR